MNKIVTSIAIISIFMSCSVLNTESDYDLAKFDSQLWKNYSESDENKRYEMITDLFSNYIRNGMSQTEVSELLGIPEYETLDCYNYYIGWSPNSGSYFRIDGDVLSIEFIDSKVSNYHYYES